MQYHRGMPDELGHYRLRREIGRGAMGRVYLADDTRLDRQIALKVLPPELAGNAERLARFQREASAAAALAAHPNIVGVHDVGRDGEVFYLAMELVTGANSFDEAIAGGEMTPDAIARCGVKLARALAQDTPVLLLDEPTNHLDLKHQVNFLTLVRKLTREKGLAVLMAMHDLNLVSANAERVALMVDGELCAVGKPGEVLTAEVIRETYDVPVSVMRHPASGASVILPGIPEPEGK